MLLRACTSTLLVLLTFATTLAQNLAQSNEPVLRTTFQSPVKSVIKTDAYQPPNQFAEFQATPHSILWLGDLEHATELSLQTGRPILIHFEQPQCRGSVHANQVTFQNPEFIKTVYEQFIPVRINVLAKPELGKRFEITQTPTDIILDAEGEQIFRGITEPNAASYATKLATFTSANATDADALAIDVGFEVDTVSFDDPIANPVAPAAYPQQIPQANRNNIPRPQYPNGPTRKALPSTYPQTAQPQPPLQTQPQQPIRSTVPVQLQPPQIQIPPISKSQPQLGLSGYCPVSLSDLNQEGAKWIKGDPQYGIIHRGRLYLFAGEHEMNVFRKYPERLAPVLSGFDPVVFADQRKLVDGIRELGVSYKGQVYLFQNKQSIQQFWTAPEHYAAAVNAAMQRTR